MIIRTPQRDRYVTIVKSSVEDSRLSWKARGLLACLLAKPDNWKVMTAQLVNAAPDGRASVLSGLRELEAAGYIVRRTSRRDDGAFDGTETEVHESPQAENRTAVQNPRSQPECGFPQAGNPQADNRPLKKKQRKKTEVKEEASLATAEPSRKSELRKAMLEEFARNPEEMTKSGLGAFNKALSELYAVGAAPEEVGDRLRQLRHLWPNVRHTPTALSKHWDDVGPPYAWADSRSHAAAVVTRPAPYVIDADIIHIDSRLPELEQATARCAAEGCDDGYVTIPDAGRGYVEPCSTCGGTGRVAKEAS
jgi:hypothetical protein